MSEPAPLEDRIDRTIYPMPQFVSLEVSDLEVSRRWYREAAGFVELAVLPGPGGAPSLVHLRRYRFQDILLVPADGPVVASEHAVVGVGFAGDPDQLDEQARRARAVGSGRVEGPVETPWFTVDLRLWDPDGHRLTLTARSTRDMPAEWAATVQESVVDT